MARLTCRREVRRFMVRIGRAVVVGQVATHARCRQTIILPARVTLVAAGLNMLTGQRELCRIVIVVCIPVISRMACLALIAKPSRLVIRFSRAIIVSLMTRHTCRRQTVILAARVTLVATGQNVLTC